MTTPHPPPRIPRSQWSSHRNYPDQLLLLGSHRNFRSISQRLIEAADEGVDARRIAWVFERWLMGMHSHEGYEERKLYPYLEARHGAALAHLREGHAQLRAAQVRVWAALGRSLGLEVEGEGVVEPEETVEGETLAAALRVHDGILDAHLEAEEDAVIPLLLEMEGAEFERYVEQPIDALLSVPR